MCYIKQTDATDRRLAQGYKNNRFTNGRRLFFYINSKQEPNKEYSHSQYKNSILHTITSFPC